MSSSMATISRKRATISARRMRSSSLPALAPADWPSVPDLFLDLVLSKLSSCLEDCLVVATTCRHWRLAVKQCTISTRTNWLIPITVGQDNHQTATAVRVFPSKQFHLDLPEISGFTTFGSRFGWLVAFRARTEFLEPEFKLFNPFSKASIPLPDRIGDFEFCVVNAALTASPGHEDCLVVVEYVVGKIAFTKPGSNVWRRISPYYDVCGFLYLNRNLYCLRRVQGQDSYRCVSHDLLSQHNPIREAEIACPPQLLAHHIVDEDKHTFPIFYNLVIEEALQTETWIYMTYHLAEMKGELCMVVRFFDDGRDSHIEIFKLKTDTNEWSRVESLGDSCLVIQDKINLSLVDVREDSRLIRGCIYYPTQSVQGIIEKKVIYYPSPSIYGMWTTSDHYTLSPTKSLWRFLKNDPPSVPTIDLHDTYSIIYPSIILGTDHMYISSCL